LFLPWGLYQLLGFYAFFLLLFVTVCYCHHTHIHHHHHRPNNIIHKSWQIHVFIINVHRKFKVLLLPHLLLHNSNIIEYTHFRITFFHQEFNSLYLNQSEFKKTLKNSHFQLMRPTSHDMRFYLFIESFLVVWLFIFLILVHLSFQ